MKLAIALSIVFATVCIVALAVHYLFGRERRPSAGRARFIAHYMFPAELGNRVHALHPELHSDQVPLVLEGLRQYFLVCLTARSGGIARHVGMPSKAVDDAWHEFILMTHDYSQFCRRAFGRYLHHVPDGQMHEPMGDALANTLHQLGRRAPSPAGWAMLGAMPLLFAVDRELGVSAGHSYDAAALADLKAKRLQDGPRGASCGGGSCGGSSAHCDAGGAAACHGGGGSCGGASCGAGGCGGGH
jgi:hypothetical protein